MIADQREMVDWKLKVGSKNEGWLESEGLFEVGSFRGLGDLVGSVLPGLGDSGWLVMSRLLREESVIALLPKESVVAHAAL